MKFYDSHVHSDYSPDSESAIEAMAAAAVQRNVRGICFTDHAEFAPDEFEPTSDDVSERFEALIELREQYAGHLEVQTGVEIGYYPGRASDIRHFIGEHEFDYILGSVHVIDGYRYSFQSCPVDEARRYYCGYIESVKAMLEEIDIDAIGHFDLPKRHGPKLPGAEGKLVEGLEPASPFWPDVINILKDAISTGVILEINSSGLRQSPGDLYPSRAILKEYVNQGARIITLGSDSHRPSNVGWGLKAARARALQANLTEAAWFIKRENHVWPLK